MKGRTSSFKAALAVAAVMLAGGLALTSSAAEARVWVDVGVGVPYPYYYPPYYYYPPPVVYTPPPVVYAPPAQPVPAGAPAPQSWYYCDNPQGYYPYVSACPAGWHEVPAQK